MKQVTLVHVDKNNLLVSTWINSTKTKKSLLFNIKCFYTVLLTAGLNCDGTAFLPLVGASKQVTQVQGSPAGSISEKKKKKFMFEQCWEAAAVIL